MGGFSAHAGQNDLLDWFSVVAPSRPRTIITHGEDRARNVFSDLIYSRFGLQSERPALGDVIEI
jgi:metallo-beta-lactamase family protein